MTGFTSKFGSLQAVFFGQAHTFHFPTAPPPTTPTSPVCPCQAPAALTGAATADLAQVGLRCQAGSELTHHQEHRGTCTHLHSGWWTPGSGIHRTHLSWFRPEASSELNRYFQAVCHHVSPTCSIRNPSQQLPTRGKKGGECDCFFPWDFCI